MRLRALWALVLAGSASAEVINGDFEAGEAAAWSRFGSDVTLQRQPAPGWVRLDSTFDTQDYATLRLYLRIETGIGTVCLDDVQIRGLQLANAGFERADGDRLADWGQDNVGGTIFVGTDGALEGSRCVCLHHERGATSRVWQDLVCAPGRRHELSFWVRTQDFRGDAYAEIYGVKDGQLGSIIWQSSHVTGAAGTRLGHTILRLSSTEEGRGGIEQRVAVEPGRNLVLVADLAAPLMPGGRVGVSAWTGDQLLGEVALDQPQGQWQWHSTVFQSPGSGDVTLRVRVEGRVDLAYVDNVAIREAAEVTPAARAEFVEAERNLPLGDALTVTLPDPAPEVLATGLGVVDARFRAITRGAVRVAAAAVDPTVTVVLGDPGPVPVPWQADQSYVLAGSESGVRITAPNALGALYGLLALPDLLDQTPAGTWQLLAARLEDAPALPLRAAYVGGLPRDRTARLRLCERLLALRMNAVLIEDDIWWRLDSGADRRLAQEAFADLRAHGLDPIPELQSFGWAHLVLAIDPMAAEGQWVEREQLTLSGDTPTRLAHPNVLRTEATDIAIENAQGIRYAEGRDYEVLNGETRHVYRPDAPPYAVRRLPGGRIPDGAIVHASYDYVSYVNSQNCPYCPSEPRVARIMEAAVRNTVRHLRPAALHIGHDEPAAMNSDSRCRSRDMTNAQLFAEDVRRLYDAAHAVDPQVTLMMWADALNPYHNGLQFPQDPTAEALPLLPRDIVMNVWFYGADQPATVGADSLRHFAAFGLATTGSPWDDPDCAVAWSRVCREARLRGEECLGVIYTSWGDRWDGLEACARSAWQPLKTPTQVVAEGTP